MIRTCIVQRQSTHHAPPSTSSPSGARVARRTTHNEEQGAKSHFLGLCELLGVPKPGSEAGYVFEEKSALIGGRTGYADVSRAGNFAW